jgi:hypothetical protein
MTWYVTPARPYVEGEDSAEGGGGGGRAASVVLVDPAALSGEFVAVDAGEAARGAGPSPPPGCVPAAAVVSVPEHAAAAGADSMEVEVRDSYLLLVTSSTNLLCLEGPARFACYVIQHVANPRISN